MINYYLHVFYAFMTHLTFSEYLSIFRLQSSSPSFFKWLQISKKIFNLFIEKNIHIGGPTELKPVFFEDQLYFQNNVK